METETEKEKSKGKGKGKDEPGGEEGCPGKGIGPLLAFVVVGGAVAIEGGKGALERVQHGAR